MVPVLMEEKYWRCPYTDMYPTNEISVYCLLHTQVTLLLYTLLGIVASNVSTQHGDPRGLPQQFKSSNPQAR